MNTPGYIWLGLSAVAASFGLALGVPIWLTAGAFGCAILPALVGMFMRGSVAEAQATEVESALWIALATAGAASTGGATAMLALYGVAVGLAWFSGRRNLILEIAGFAMLGLAVAMLAGSGGGWMHRNDAVALTTGYGIAGVVQLAVLAGAWATQRAQPVVAGAQPDVDGRLKDMETRLRSASASAEEARAQALEARDKLERRTTFFAQTSHELRTPLNAIVGFADMMRSGIFGPLPERYQEYSELIHEGGRNLTLVVDDVLDLARLEAGKYDIYPEPVSLTDLAEEAVRFMGDEAARKRVDLYVAGQDDAEAFADSKAVRQIALNLISNALKFTPAEGSVAVIAEEVPGGARLVVADTGVGIGPEDLEKLSRAFEQGDAGKKQKGAGLGLSVVRAFADLHGGKLTIESRVDGGTRISVFFPAEVVGGGKRP
jgi:signal transduction histidine kinase